MPNNKRLSIPTSDQTRADFEHIASKHDLTQEQTLELLIKSYREVEMLKQQLSAFRPKLSESEIDQYREASSRSGLSQGEILKNGLINEVKSINAKFERMADLEKWDNGQRKNRDGSASARINIAVNKIRSHNDKETEKDKKFFICETAIQKLSGSNRSAIKEYMELYKNKIAIHNNKHRLTATGNLKAKGWDIKTVLGKAEESATES